MKFVFNCNDRKGFRKEVDEVGVILTPRYRRKGTENTALSLLSIFIWRLDFGFRTPDLRLSN